METPHRIGVIPVTQSVASVQDPTTTSALLVRDRGIWKETSVSSPVQAPQNLKTRLTIGVTHAIQAVVSAQELQTQIVPLASQGNFLTQPHLSASHHAPMDTTLIQPPTHASCVIQRVSRALMQAAQAAYLAKIQDFCHPQNALHLAPLGPLARLAQVLATLVIPHV